MDTTKILTSLFSLHYWTLCLVSQGRQPLFKSCMMLRSVTQHKGWIMSSKSSQGIKLTHQFHLCLIPSLPPPDYLLTLRIFLPYFQLPFHPYLSSSLVSFHTFCLIISPFSCVPFYLFILVTSLFPHFLSFCAPELFLSTLLLSFLLTLLSHSAWNSPSCSHLCLVRRMLN